MALGLVLAVVFALVVIGLMISGFWEDYSSTPVEDTCIEDIRLEIAKACAGAANAEQWAKDLVAKWEEHLRGTAHK